MNNLAELAIAVISQLQKDGSKLLSEYHCIRGSANSSLAENVDTEVLAAALRGKVELVTAYALNLHLNTDANLELELLCKQAISVANEIRGILEKLRVKGATRWASFMAALRSVRSKEEINQLRSRMKELHDEVRHQQRTLEERNEMEKISQKLHGIEQKIDRAVSCSSRNNHALIQDLHTIITLFKSRPKQLGYPWETGSLKDHIRIDDGLGPEYPLPLFLCSSLELMLSIICIRFASESLPGKHSIEAGHVEFLTWDETKVVDSKSWLSHVKPGSGLKLNFVMSTGIWLPSRKCIRCGKPLRHDQPRSRKAWKSCGSCDLKFREADTEQFPFEGEEFWHDPQSYHNFKAGNYRLPKAGSAHQGVDARGATTSTSVADTHDTTRRLILNEKNSDPPIGFVGRRIIVKWDPFWNITHRYLLCRCILRRSTPTRPDICPELTILVPTWCPRHNCQGVRFPDYGDLSLCNPRVDPYFERFGGYDAFRAGLFIIHDCDPSGPLHELGGQQFLPLDEVQAVRDALEDVQWREAFDEYLRSIRRNTLIIQGESQEKIAAERSKSYECLVYEVNHELMEPELAMNREIKEILEGRWNGKPHWLLDD